MRQFEVLPIDRLVNDVAVDPMHVRELADSIKVSGPISPVMVRQESYELIDGFHRVAAMQELGFNQVECILTSCDDETFWDLSIMSASLHKAVTFSRATEWIEECFRLSSLRASYKSAFSMFDGVSNGWASQEAKAWAQDKCQKWGLAPGTIRNWLYTKATLDPSLAKTMSHESGLPFTHYYRVAQVLNKAPELQKKVIQKAKAEGLTAEQTLQVARAVAKAPDPGIVSGILIQPVSRTADDLTRSAKVERLINEPVRIPPPKIKQRELTGRALEVYLGLEQQIYNIGRLNDDVIANLSPGQRDEFGTMLAKLAEKIGELREKIGGSDRKLVEGHIVSLR